MKTKNLFVALISTLFAFQACTTDDVSLVETGPVDGSNLYSIKDDAFGEYLKYLKINGVYSQVSNENGNAVISYVIDTVESQNYTGEINLNKSGTFTSKLETAGLVTAKEKIANLDGIQYFPGTTSLILTSNELTSIDLRQLVNLTSLNLNNNWIGSLDLSQNTKLKTLLYNASGSASAPENSKLVNIDLTHNLDLDTISMTNHELESIDLSQNTKLKGVNFKGNSNTLYVPQEVYDRLNTTTGLQVESPIDPGDNMFVIPDKALGEYLNYRLNGTDIIVEDGSTYKIDKTKAANYTGALNLSKNGDIPTELQEAGLSTAKEKLTNLDGIQFFTGITSLKLITNEITEIDVSALINLTVLDLNNNKISSLDVTKNTKLTELNCKASSKATDAQKLTSIDLSKNTELTAINFENNLFTTIDLTANTKLTSINFLKNKNTITIPADLYDQIETAGGDLKGVTK